MKALAVLTGLFFFSAGNFGFLNLFGIRRETQAAVLLLLFVLALPHARKADKHALNVFVVLPFTVFVFGCFSMFQPILLVNFFVAGGLVFLAYTLEWRFSELAGRAIVWLAGLFSALVIIQLVIFCFEPYLFAGLGPLYSSDTADQVVVVQHPIQYLGFFSAAEDSYLFGFNVPRFYSFSSEPSVLAYSFLAPGLLGLTFRGAIRFPAILCLVFSILLAQSGVLWLSCAAGICMIGLLVLVERYWSLKSKYVALLLTGWVTLAIGLLAVSDLGSMVARFMGLTRELDVVSTVAATKESSATARLEGIQAAVALILDRPWGVREKLTIGGAIGALLELGFSLGYLGVGLGLVYFYCIVKDLVEWFRISRDRWVLVGVGGIIGTVFQAFIFSGYGWMSASGCLLMAVIARRARFVSLEARIMEDNGTTTVAVRTPARMIDFTERQRSNASAEH